MWTKWNYSICRTLMTEPMSIVPDCAPDQGRWVALLDSLVSLYDDVSDLCVLLLTIQHGNLDADEYAIGQSAIAIAGKVVNDWAIVAPLIAKLQSADC